MSTDLVWELVKKNNKFQVTRDGVTFSKERGNLMNLNSRRFSGIANRRTVHVGPKPTKTKKGFFVDVGVSVRRKRGTRVNNHVTPCVLRKHMVKGSCVGAATVRKTVTGIRHDLTKFAVARYHRVKQMVATQKKMAIWRKKAKAAKATKASAAKVAAAAAAPSK